MTIKGKGKTNKKRKWARDEKNKNILVNQRRKREKKKCFD